MLSSNSIVKLWGNLTTPSPELAGEEKRQAGLLLSMSVVSWIVTVIGSLLAFSSTIHAGTMFLIFGLVVTLSVNYVISRTRYYVWAAYLFALIPVIIISISSVIASGAAGTFFLFFMSISPLLASLVLPVSATWIVSGITVGIVVLLVNIIPNWRTGTIDELIFNTAVCALVLVSATIREKYLRQINQQLVELEQAERAAQAAREKAELSDKVKSAFLASMSHELRTPLNAIINFTQFVVEGDLGEVNEEQVETLEQVIRSSRHLLGLINDVLDMSKIESGSLALFIVDDVNLNQILDMMISTGKSLVGEKAVSIETDIADNLPLMRGDRQRLLQIMLNIMSNACKFTDEGVIRVKAWCDQGEVRVDVKDNGPGIAPEDHEKIFKAFQQTSAGLRQGGGTGLGMPISKNLAEAHGGRLWVTSTPDQGATFSVALPIRNPNLVPMARKEVA